MNQALKTPSLLRLYFALSLMFFTFSSCNRVAKEPVSPQPDDLTNSVLLELNHLSYTIANEHDQFYSFIGVRALTMVHLAIHDAINSIDPQFESYLFSEKTSNADPVSAAISATQTILLEAYPDRADTIKQVCMQLVKPLSGAHANAGTALGAKIASKYIQLRQGDGHQKQGDYTPMTKPGDYQYTPGFDNWVLYPDFSIARPFTMDTVTQFRVPPPPDLDSEIYAQAYNEVKEYGMKNSTVRSEDQTHFAHWWAEFGEHSWNRIGRIVAEAESLSFAQTARMFALLNMNLYDLYLASLESKYHYDTWRPYTAIREGSTALNTETEPDPNWEPEMLTPPWPEYPSAHAAVGAAGAEIVSQILGTSKVSFTMESVSALPGAKVRTYNDLDKAAQDCADSRIMNGYHFRFATEEGLKQGRTLAKYVMSNFLLPLEE